MTLRRRLTAPYDPDVHKGIFPPLGYLSAALPRSSSTGPPLETGPQDPLPTAPTSPRHSPLHQSFPRNKEAGGKKIVLSPKSPRSLRSRGSPDLEGFRPPGENARDPPAETSLPILTHPIGARPPTFHRPRIPESKTPTNRRALQPADTRRRRAPSLPR